MEITSDFNITISMNKLIGVFDIKAKLQDWSRIVLSFSIYRDIVILFETFLNRVRLTDHHDRSTVMYCIVSFQWLTSNSTRTVYDRWAIVVTCCLLRGEEESFTKLLANYILRF